MTSPVHCVHCDEVRCQGPRPVHHLHIAVLEHTLPTQEHRRVLTSFARRVPADAFARQPLGFCHVARLARNVNHALADAPRLGRKIALLIGSRAAGCRAKGFDVSTCFQSMVEAQAISGDTNVDWIPVVELWVVAGLLVIAFWPRS